MLANSGMTSAMLPEIRLFVDAPLSAGASITCTPEQANYLVNVMRLAAGAEILVFNGREGEWRAHLADVGADDDIGEGRRPGDVMGR